MMGWLRNGCAPRKPDMLVIGSGFHDINMPVPRFNNNMRALANKLRRITDMGTHVRFTLFGHFSLFASSQSSRGPMSHPRTFFALYGQVATADRA